MKLIVVPGRLISPTQIELSVPVDLSESEIEVEIRVKSSHTEGSQMKLVEFLLDLQGRNQNKPGRTKEDIDQQIREERDSWETGR
ncbi:MAG: hypothetical protein SFU86_11380 [Pirellulaceae bacterium]|nr:hypothetical protein [Pirellulaceae bacterium]